MTPGPTDLFHVVTESMFEEVKKAIVFKVSTVQSSKVRLSSNSQQQQQQQFQSKIIVQLTQILIDDT